MPILIIFLLIKLKLVSARSTDNSLVVKLVSVMVVLEFVNVPLISDNFGSLYQEYAGNVSLLIEFRKFIFVSNRFILEKLKLNFVVLFVYIVLAVLLDKIIFLRLFKLNSDTVVKKSML